ncbi:fatty acid synthase-like [Trichogramma pretiosum]|uniref:fatty acid synthase-like n=1 Tax=Trichogramma pretiosum TaxID=7493 RepID=UPI000C71C399|nr:fatty acid synthase-like [Trichogramma pretiosum]
MSKKWLEDPDIRPRKVTPVAPEDEVVISGIAGRFPDSNNCNELYENLMNKVDLVTDDDRRWKLDHPEIPQRTGKINNVEKFDALFFGVHFKQAHTMDPMCRMFLEHAYEALIDAGVNPRAIRGTKCGVFVGACFSESEKTWFYEKLQVNGFGITGCARSMLSNRISYWLGVTGPSYTIDTACSSSMYAFEHAYRAIKEGLCDTALVGGGNLCLHPFVSMQFFKLGVLSTDGRCKTFDESANGYVRSESMAVAFLQKSKDAKRIYATLVHGKLNCDGFKEQGVTFPSCRMQTVLLKEFYLECGIPPKEVEYIEAHGTGTRVGDPEEVNAIDSALCEERTKEDPLLIGSIKTNLGHTEPASGIVSVAKVIMSMETGVIPPNLHFKTPRQDIQALVDGRIKVIAEPTRWKARYAGISAFGFGGANAHVLLKSNPKLKVNRGAPRDDLPRLVAITGRTEEAVDVILKDLESKPVDVEYVRLLHDIHSDEINGNLYRGYTILPAKGVTEKPIREIQAAAGSKRPIWFVFSGMGSQWPGMGEALLQIPIFAEAIKKCDAVLKPNGIDIYHVITNKEKTAFDNILNSFVGIAAVQIGLVDILRAIGIVPDNIIGHSVGELGCAYADGCFTAEQMILSAYSRGKASLEANIIRGSMAAVGLGYEKLKPMCPADIEIACHNSAESSTVSGPAEAMKAFVADLQAKKIFAREVACSNIPYHSKHIAPAGAKLLEYLKKVIPNPKPRSEKWLSTSVPIEKWDTKAAKYSSPEYHTNNLLSSVLFEETSAFIPKDAITIEIAPHGLLQAIIRRSLHSSVTNIPLTQRGHANNTEFLLQALGKLFNVGLHFQLDKLYPHVQYPVSRSTQMIAPLIRWEHSDDWYVTSYKSQQKISSGERTVKVALSDADYEHMAGHVIDGRNLFPATGYLNLVWETLGMMHGELHTEVSVVFEDIKFLRATNIPKEGEIEFTLMIQKGTGRFEVVEGGVAVVTGHVRVCSNPEAEKINVDFGSLKQEEETMSSRDVYKELRLRGYHYSGLFRSIKSSTVTGSYGHISWANNWVAFMDNMLQMQILGVDTRGLFVPISIKKLVIDTKAHLGDFKFGELEKDLPVYTDKVYDVIACGGVEIRGLQASAIARKKPAGEPVLEEYRFVAHHDRASLTLREISRLSTHLCMENNFGVKVKTVELLDIDNEVSPTDLLSPWLAEALGDMPLIQAEVTIYGPKKKLEAGSLPSNVLIGDVKKINPDLNALLAIGHNLLTKEKADELAMLQQSLKEGGFILTRESAQVRNIDELAKSHGLDVILEKSYGKEIFMLLKNRTKVPEKTVVVQVNNQNFDWVENMKKTMQQESENPSTRILYVGQGDFENGLMGLVNCLRQEPGGELVRGLLIQDPKAPPFSLTNPMYARHLDKDLAVSVLRENGVWGSYRHLPLPTPKREPVRHALASQLVRGDLSSLAWLEGPIQKGSRHPDLVNIFYASINFKDVMLASGKLAIEAVCKTRQDQEHVIGIEYSGIDQAGKRIMGMIPSRALANVAIADRHLSWEIPKSWTLEDAATIPCVYGTCYYALYVSGKMKRGDKVLIHAGSGGVGQSAINLCLHEGCEVFTTVGTPEKRRFIREHFPQIPESHIGNSRDTSFEQMIARETKGRGVDIVLNSLAEEKLLASVNCLAWGGRFLEIGKFDLSANNPLGMQAFLKEISFHGVMLDAVFVREKEDKQVVQKLLEQGLKSGAVKPLVRTVFEKDQIEEAFRYMAAGKHIGKVVIKMREDNEAKSEVALAIPRYYCLPDKSYLILGGLGGFGLELADWLVLRGAKNLVVTSRSGVKNGYQRMRISLWESYGTRVVVIAGKDASKRDDCQAILEAANKVAPLDAIFNLAVVLQDALWDNQTAESFEESFRSKAWATKNLDLLTRKLCPALRNFVVFSSVSCGRGNAGQTNYGMSNSVMERICERRAAEGLPGLAIQWGAVGDVGLVADMQEDNKELVIGGTLQQRISSCLQELDGFMRQNKPVVASMVVAEKRAGGSGALNVVDTVLNIMGLKTLKGVSLNTSLAELGMDSMMSVEIKQTLEREFEIFLTAGDIRNLNFTKLKEMSVDSSAGENASDSDGQAEGEILTGMKLLVRLIGDGDLNPEVCLRLRTKEETGQGEIFLVPGIEGVGSVFTNLAPNLKAPATCLQLGLSNAAHDSVYDMANHFLPHVLDRSKGRRNFVIVGYSFGSLIAIEIVRKLESQGMSGQLILIDGAPDQLQVITSNQITANSDEELQSHTLMAMINIVHPDNSLQLNDDLAKCKSWEEKIQAFVNRCPASKLSMTVENQKALCSAIYNRIRAIENYTNSKVKPIKSPITLLKPTLPSVRMDFEDYGLSKLTTDKVQVHYVPGNHVTMLDNEKISQAINGDSIEDAQAFKNTIMDK